jgi:hypothetical protein
LVVGAEPQLKNFDEVIVKVRARREWVNGESASGATFLCEKGARLWVERMKPNAATAAGLSVFEIAGKSGGPIDFALTTDYPHVKHRKCKRTISFQPSAVSKTQNSARSHSEDLRFENL